MRSKNVIFVCLCFLMSCQAHQADVSPANTGPKNVILMIGDGMGPAQLSMAIDYRRVMQPDAEPLAFEKLFANNHSGRVRTHAEGTVLTDSAAAATAMACGTKTLPGILGEDENGKSCESILEWAQKRGMLTGLVSTMRVTHATPAAFYAHIVSRDDENLIAEQLMESQQPDVLLGGGARHFISQKLSELPDCKNIDPLMDGSSKRGDKRDLLKESAFGYHLLCTREQLDHFEFSAGQKVLGTFSADHLPQWQERHDLAQVPSLAHMTDKALEWLSKGDKGFFVMIEGGHIDFAGHANNAGTLLREVLDFDAAVARAYDYVQQHPDTLLLVTADHEAGGFGYTVRTVLNESEMPNIKLASGELYTNNEISPDGHMIFSKLVAQKISFQELLMPIVFKLYPNDNFTNMNSAYSLDQAAQDLKSRLEAKSAYTITLDEARRVLAPEHSTLPEWDIFHAYQSHPFLHAFNRLGLVLSPQNFIVWSSADHTAVPVDLLCAGPEKAASRCRRLIDNTQIYHIMKDHIESH